MKVFALKAKNVLWISVMVGGWGGIRVKSKFILTNMSAVRLVYQPNGKGTICG